MVTPTPSSPRAPTLHLTTLSRILLWGARAKRNAGTAPHDNQDGSATVAASSSAAIQKTVKSLQHCIQCSSGTEVQTHSRIVDAHPKCRKSDVIRYEDVFECQDGVDTRLLLRLSRRRVLETVELLGGNTIIDEWWSCTIRKDETRRGVVYRVFGIPARCSLPDPQRPIAIDEVKGVPGLMRVVSRQ